MQDYVQMIQNKVSHSVVSNTLCTAWLSNMAIDQAKYYNRALTKLPKNYDNLILGKTPIERKTNAESIAKWAEDKLIKILQVEKDYEELPLTITEFIVNINKFKDNIEKVAELKINEVNYSKRARFLAALYNTIKPWQDVLTHLNKSYKLLEAIADFTDGDDINDFPYQGYEVYTELKEMDYLSRILII